MGLACSGYCAEAASWGSGSASILIWPGLLQSPLPSLPLPSSQRHLRRSGGVISTGSQSGNRQSTPPTEGPGMRLLLATSTHSSKHLMTNRMGTKGGWPTIGGKEEEAVQQLLFSSPQWNKSWCRAIDCSIVPQLSWTASCICFLLFWQLGFYTVLTL